MQEFGKDHGEKVLQNKDDIIDLGDGEYISKIEWDEVINKIIKQIKKQNE